MREAAASEGRAGDGGKRTREREARELGPGSARCSGRRMASRGAGIGRRGMGGREGGGERGGPGRGGRTGGGAGVARPGIVGEGSGVETEGGGKEGSERGGAEKGGKGGRARAEDGEGGGASRIVEVCAERGFSPVGEGFSTRGLWEPGRTGTQEIAGMLERGSRWGGGG